MLHRQKIRQAFSLAEVLITLGIIGFVVAITIPNLMNDIHNTQFKQAWKKEYSVINQAYQLAKQDEGGDLSEYFTGANDSMVTIPFINKMKDYLKTSESCDAYSARYNYLLCSNSSDNPLHQHYNSMSNVKMDRANLFYYQIQLTDGAIIYARTYISSNAIIWVDVNGYEKKPNVIGRDLFGMVMTKDKIIPIGSVGSGAENTCNSTPFTTSISQGYASGTDISGAGCSAEYLYN